MGRVKTKSIKRIAKYLLEMYPDAFNKDFEHNKQVLKEKSPVPLTKKERNKIAGYIVRLIKLKEKTTEKEAETEEEESTETEEQ
ncbi:MAG: 30S ribosomal protein S17e [Thermoproteota archaeon]|nr:30S ribosomal protein S17e [Thermoproteota archaeon]